LPVLVLGPTGTGKEIVADEIHRKSQREGKFVPVNCAAIAPNLIDSELFGHVRGAFSGATEDHDGLFRKAERGTLFLDEIGELSLELQGRLLRVLENGEVRPVGSSAASQIDVRVIAATNVVLDQAVSEGHFRPDLFARLDQLRIELPPLHQRREDIFLLTQHFAQTDQANGPRLTFDADAAEALLVYSWPFNVRELKKVIQVLRLEHPAAGLISHADLPTPLRLAVALDGKGQAGELSQAKNSLAEMEELIARGDVPTQAQLEAGLIHFEGKVADLAQYLNKDRKQIYRWLKRYGLRSATYRR